MGRVIHTAINYDPQVRGLQLALAYSRVPKPGERGSHELLGAIVAFCGRGFFSDNSYVDDYFHVGQRRGEGYVSYTGSELRLAWGDDRIGGSGLAGTDFGEGVEEVLELVRDRLFDHWIEWVERDGSVFPDLRDSVKRKLGCERRSAFYVSPRFDQSLLNFIEPAWQVPLRY